MHSVDGSLWLQRAVLVPTLRALGSGVVVAQTRGTSFSTACAAARGEYEVDVIHPDGRIETEVIELEGDDRIDRIVLYPSIRTNCLE